MKATAYDFPGSQFEFYIEHRSISSKIDHHNVPSFARRLSEFDNVYILAGLQP